MHYKPRASRNGHTVKTAQSYQSSANDIRQDTTNQRSASPSPNRASGAKSLHHHEGEGFIEHLIHRFTSTEEDDESEIDVQSQTAKDTSPHTSPRSSPRLSPRSSPRLAKRSPELRHRYNAMSSSNRNLSVDESVRPRSSTLDPSFTHNPRHSYASASQVKRSPSPKGAGGRENSPSSRDRLVQETKEKYRAKGKSSVTSSDASKPVSHMTHLKPDSSMNSESMRMGRSLGQLDQLRQNLAERGEKVGLLEDNTEALKHNSKSLTKTAHLLAEKYKKKRWYEL